MIDLEVEMVHQEEEEEEEDMMTTGSSQMCITQLIDTSIKDITNNKNSLGLKMESVMRLMREVECQEKAAEQAKEDAAQSSLHVLVKLDECKKALRHAEETNETLVRKLCVQKAVLATKMEVFQLRSSHLFDDGSRFLQVLDEMSRSLEMRLTSALTKKELAVKKKQENEDFAEAALACEGIQMKKVEQEYKNLKHQARETSKLLEFLIDGGQVLDMLHEEMSDKYQNVQQLKEEVEQGSPLMSILESFYTECNCSKNEAVITEEGPSISTDDFVENSRDVKKKLCGNKLCGKSIKKVKIRKNYKFVKKIKIKGLQVVSKRTAAADHQDDDDIEMVTLGILLIYLLFFILSIIGF